MMGKKVEALRVEKVLLEVTKRIQVFDAVKGGIKQNQSTQNTKKQRNAPKTNKTMVAYMTHKNVQPKFTAAQHVARQIILSRHVEL